MFFTFVIKSAEKNIRFIGPDVVSRHPSILIRLLNLAVFKIIIDTVYYYSNLTQQHKPKILQKFHFQSTKILLSFIFLSTENNLPGKHVFPKAMLLWTVFITLCKNLVTKRIEVSENYLKFWTINIINITKKKKKGISWIISCLQQMILMSSKFWGYLFGHKVDP